MEVLFSGFILFSYILSYYAREPIFVAAIAFPLLFSLFAVVLPFMGRKGKMCRAARRAKRMARGGAIVPENAELFYTRCVVCGGVRFCLAYKGFMEGKVAFYEFANSAKGIFNEVRQISFAVFDGVSAVLALLVFACFYWVCPLAETLIRVCAAAVTIAISRLVATVAVYGYSASAKRAAYKVCEIAQNHLLPRHFEAPGALYGAEMARQTPQSPESGVERLRRMLKSIDDKD